MKKVKFFLLTSILFSFLVSCKKNSDFTHVNPITNLGEIENLLGKELVSLANKNPEFKRVVEEECLKQVRSDYNVSINKVLEISLQKQLISDENGKKIDELLKQMISLKPGRLPIIFVPVVETYDVNARIYKGTSLSGKYESRSKNDVSITVVSRDAQVAEGDLYPGYRFNSFGRWETCGLINEDFAWKNDVWVIGYEENVSGENRAASTKHSNKDSLKTVDNKQLRVDGRAEYGGRIQVLDLSAFESWANGKPEFKYFVHNAFGTLIKERGLEPWARSNYSNQQWFEYDDFIGYWNTSNWGNITYERWIEEDGGNPITISHTIPNPSGGPTMTITSTIKDDDENLGLANVQFSDPYYGEIPYSPSSWTVYNITHMNFQRK